MEQEEWALHQKVHNMAAVIENYQRLINDFKDVNDLVRTWSQLRIEHEV